MCLVEISNEYAGYKVVTDDDPLIQAFYEDPQTNHFQLLENEYLTIRSHENNVIIDKYKWQDGKYRTLWRKPIESMAVGKTKPKNFEQSLAIDMLLDDSVTVKAMTGTFGSGKTFLSCACAFQLLESKKFDKIVWLRNNIEVKDSNSIGYLKGDYMSKMSVWAMPLADHLGGREALDMYIQKGMIEVEHLGFIRGRDIKHSIVFCSEAEHLTRDHAKLILGRIGEGSILIFEGDCRQIDAKAFERDNGLKAIVDCLKGNRLFSYIHLSESVRSDTAKLADLL